MKGTGPVMMTEVVKQMSEALPGRALKRTGNRGKFLRVDPAAKVGKNGRDVVKSTRDPIVILKNPPRQRTFQYAI